MGSDFYLQYILPYSGIIIKICRAYTYNQADFEDYYQEVCLQVWRSRESFSNRSEWSTWIYRIALNVCLSFLKQSNRRERNISSDSLPEEAAEQCKAFENEQINQLYSAIRQLSEVDRGIILLYLEQHSYQQIADIIGINSSHVGVKIKRIKEKLTNLLIKKSEA